MTVLFMSFTAADVAWLWMVQHPLSSFLCIWWGIWRIIQSFSWRIDSAALAMFLSCNPIHRWEKKPPVNQRITFLLILAPTMLMDRNICNFYALYTAWIYFCNFYFKLANKYLFILGLKFGVRKSTSPETLKLLGNSDKLSSWR